MDFLKRLVPMQTLYRLAVVYWFFTRPQTRGAKVVIKSGADILLLRHTYLPDAWTFPGGGIKKGESPEDTLRREIQEEVGIILGELTHVGQFETKQDYKNDTVLVYVATVSDKTVVRDQLEIAEVRWFPTESIPRLPANAKRIFDLAQSHL